MAMPAPLLEALSDLKESAVDTPLGRTEKLEKDLGSFERTLASDSSFPVADLDLMIDLLEESERAIRTSTSPKLRRIAVPEHDKKILMEALERLRDARWRIMARRSELESPGSAPVFEDPEALLAFLNAR